MKGWRYTCTHSWPCIWLKIRGQLHCSDGLITELGWMCYALSCSCTLGTIPLELSCSFPVPCRIYVSLTTSNNFGQVGVILHIEVYCAFNTGCSDYPCIHTAAHNSMCGHSFCWFAWWEQCLWLQFSTVLAVITLLSINCALCFSFGWPWPTA